MKHLFLFIILSLSVNVSANFCEKEILVSLYDSPYDLEHEALFNKLWTNPGEIPDDKLDNDGNGFVDDLHGWDTGDDDKNISYDFPENFCDSTCRRYLAVRFKKRAGLASPEELKWLEQIVLKNPKLPTTGSDYISLFHGTSTAGLSVQNTTCAKWYGIKASKDVDLFTTPDKNYTLTGTRPTEQQLMRLSRELLLIRLSRFMPGKRYFQHAEGTRVVALALYFGAESIIERLDFEIKERYNYQLDKETLNSLGQDAYNDFISEVTMVFSENPNVLFIFPTNNDAENVDLANYFPMHIKLPNTMVVQAAIGMEKPAPFTGYGIKTTDIAAPATSTIFPVPGSIYMQGHATSIAVPVLANAAVRVLEINPNLTAVEVKTLLIRTARVLPSFKNWNANSAVLDLEAALEAARYSVAP